MFKRKTTVILLNETNEELLLHSGTMQLFSGIWSSDMKPPTSILAGEYGVWKSQSVTVLGGNHGFLQYSINGGDTKDTINLPWRNSFLRSNCYAPTRAPRGFQIKVFGGEGYHAAVTFVLSALP
ncbi:hypothetical protein F5884DRAFT_778785 [Xylogone sp. PMI_703]|nr:hypothetical protein F5884DRAFT_778785 [Xylogone sp. PMI_703]